MIRVLLASWIGFGPAPADADAAASESQPGEVEPSVAGEGPEGPGLPEAEDASAGESASEEPAPVPEAAPALIETAPEGPPFYTQDDENTLRARYGIEPLPTTPPRTAKWRCLIADPTCAFTAEVNAMGAYAYRLRQGDISVAGDVNQWSSGRAAYDLWINFSAVQDVVGRHKFTRMTLGPKAGVALSDSHDLWGNFGIAARYWFGHGAWAPAIEFSTALSFKLRGERGGVVDNQRSPVGVTGDVGLNVGGWGAIVVGAQYDTPLAREEIPESVRVSSAGMFFVGFRGNILWGLPVAAAIGTQAAVQRSVTAP